MKFVGVLTGILNSYVFFFQNMHQYKKNYTKTVLVIYYDICILVFFCSNPENLYFCFKPKIDPEPFLELNYIIIVNDVTLNLNVSNQHVSHSGQK